MALKCCYWSHYCTDVLMCTIATYVIESCICLPFCVKLDFVPSVVCLSVRLRMHAKLGYAELALCACAMCCTAAAVGRTG